MNWINGTEYKLRNRLDTFMHDTVLRDTLDIRESLQMTESIFVKLDCAKELSGDCRDLESSKAEELKN